MITMKTINASDLAQRDAFFTSLKCPAMSSMTQ